MIKHRIFVTLLIFILFLSIPGLGYGKSIQGMELHEGLDDLIRQITKGLPSRNPMTVVVADFRGIDGEVTALGRYVAEEMVTKLFSFGEVRVIERGQLENALKELKFSQTDLFHPDTAKKLGKLIGADVILGGTITDLDTAIRVNARLFSSEKGEVLGVGTATIVRDGQVDRLIKILLQPQSFPKSNVPDGEEKNDRQGAVYRRFTTAPFFESDHVRVAVKSLKRSGSLLIIELWYENLTAQTMKIASSGWGRAYATDHRGTYLLSDTGEKGIFEDDTQVGNHYGGTELISHRRLLNQVTFSHDNSRDGYEFTYVGKYNIRWKNNTRDDYRNETIEVIIRNIRPGDYNYSNNDETENLPDSGYTNYVRDASGDRSRGESIYRANCVVCHGQGGDGKGPASRSLSPQPKDFSRSMMNRSQVIEVVRNGIRGTSMVGFRKTLSEKEVLDVGEYVYRFRDR